ncbi:hypothetical protein [Pseudoalteromonas xiamenensis]
MFKKSLLALALAGMSASALAATNVTVEESTALVISKQGIPSTNIATLYTAADTARADQLNFAIAAAASSAVTKNAMIVVEVTGGSFVVEGTTASVEAGTTIGNTKITNSAMNLLTSGNVASNSTRLVFDFNETGGTADYSTTTGFNVALRNVKLIASGEVKVRAFLVAAGATSATPVANTTSDYKTVAKVTSQWVAAATTNASSSSASATLFDGKIDVGNSRLTFESKGTTDQAIFDIDPATSSITSPVTESKVTVKVTGDFTGVKTLTGLFGADTTNSRSFSIAADKQSATFETTDAAVIANLIDDDAANTLTATLYSGTDKEVAALAERSFKITASIGYTHEGTEKTEAVLNEVAAGSWTLNSKTFDISYIPFGPNTKPILQATSTFAEEASVDVSYLNPTTGKMVELKDVAKVAPNSVTKLGEAISTAILADFGGASLLTKVSISIYAPNGNIKLFTGFKDAADKDRLGLGGGVN